MLISSMWFMPMSAANIVPSVSHLRRDRTFTNASNRTSTGTAIVFDAPSRASDEGAASAGLAGLGAVALLFDGVHGITVAFGFTLIGVAQDYPLHCFSHQRPGLSPWDNVRALWPTLGTGVVATCIAYLTFLASGVDGLQQLAVFTIAGLAVAALSTRFLLPALLDPAPRDPARSPRLARWWSALARWPRPRAGWFAALAIVALGVAWFAPAPTWENDLSKLTPAPAELLARDARLRADLGAPDVRYLATVRGDNAQAALRQSERLLPVLARLRDTGAIEGFDLAARYLPSVKTQRARQAALPTPDALRASLATALADSPFRAGVFAPFAADLETARTAEPLRPASLAGTPLAARLEGLLLEDADGATALVTLSGLRDPVAVSTALEAAGADLVDLKQASESLVADYRGRVLWALALAALLLAATVRLALGDTRRALRVLAPMALTTLLVLAVLRAAGVELNLFHLVALILAAGLGLDYALFFDHAGDDRDDQLRTLHALLACSAATLLVFALLSLSTIPVLRAIGTTVALGVAFNFVLALLIVRRPVRSDACGRDDILDLVPHAGAMCLWNAVESWDATRIVLRADNHRDTTHPLRSDGRLRALHLCEYGAQAMAVHGGLVARAAGGRAAPGMLVSLGEVEIVPARIDDLAGPLRGEATLLAEGAAGCQYRFRILHGGECLASGRAAVMPRG